MVSKIPDENLIQIGIVHQNTFPKYKIRILEVSENRGVRVTNYTLRVGNDL